MVVIFGRKKIRKKDIDQKLLTDIRSLKAEWETLDNIIEHSVDPSESGLADLALVKAKYFYLLREARFRGVSALS
ncbi:YaaL family protein [Halobacillus salinarum]|uniref:YaaL family protein n=1 Tax=Halobacillus salinarum TaxID=2932257 RepID=A0ABY4EKT0_9BACI|nr:YaaL family protein [Halobacillus salinarum]UOQ44698.1 YaaL family protein [Halobacillus salinarum]